ncbi:glutamine dumper 6 [Euphorbia peplus]|nr:glutamine dumper 6 [Euphorbia peplus]
MKSEELWKWPLGYVFGGLIIILGVIAVALMMVVCLQYRVASSSSSSMEKKQEDRGSERDRVIVMEPEIVVIMPGEDQPTHLATPSSLFSHSQQS